MASKFEDAHPSREIVIQIHETCGGTIATALMLMCQDRQTAHRDAESLIVKALEGVYGNRKGMVDVTWTHLRLVMAASLRAALEVLEGEVK